MTDCGPSTSCADKAIIVKARGPRGKRGYQGPPGPPGMPGARGCSGLEGPQGQRGERGPQGSQGTVGVQGRIGAQGEPGRRGPQGDPGPRGPPGTQILFGNGNPNGQALPANVGDVYIDRTTGTLYRLISNCPPVWMEETNLRGPAGAQGDRGDRGPSGPQGDTRDFSCDSDITVGLIRTKDLDECPRRGVEGKINTIVGHHIYNDLMVSPPEGYQALTPIFNASSTQMHFDISRISLYAGLTPDDASLIPGMYAIGSGFKVAPTGEASAAFNRETLATGDFSFATGFGTEARGTYSASFGRENLVAGDFSAVFGNLNQVLAQNAFGVGFQNTVEAGARYSFVGGRQSTVAADGAFAFALGSRASGIHSTVFGVGSQGIGDYSFTIGEGNTSLGRAALGTGHNTRAEGAYSFSSGESTAAIGAGAVSMGIETRAVGPYALAGGERSIASGRGSAALGYNNQANAPYSFAAGACSIAQHEAGGVIGIGLISSAEGGLVTGRFNNTTCGSHLFEVGCGRSDADRDSAFAVHTDCSSTFYHGLEALGGLKVCGPLNADNLTLRSTLVASQVKATTLTATNASISNLTVGTIAKTNGTFSIPHPTKPGYKLLHSFVESPTAGENIYRYALSVVDELTMDLPDYFARLNSQPQVWVNPQNTFGRGIGKIEGNRLTVKVDTPDIYNILIIGTRQDPGGVNAWRGPEIPED